MEKRSNFSFFPQYFQHISNFKSPITYIIVKCGCSIYFFLKSGNLICRSTDISKYFRGSLGIRDNESRLYIDDVLSLKNTKFAEYFEFIYPRELEIKETTETAASSSYLDCYLYIDNGKLTTGLYNKRDDFNFPVVNFPFLSSNIPFRSTLRRLRFIVNPLCQSLFKLSGFHGAWESAHYKVVEPGVSKNQSGSNT